MCTQHYGKTVLFLAALALLAPCQTMGEVIYVDADARGASNGTSWIDAYDDLQSALERALAPGDEIWVAEGTYNPDRGTGDPGMRFTPVSDVPMYGGFAGTEETFDQRDLTRHTTILSGDLNGDDQPGFVNYGDNSLWVIDVQFDAEVNAIELDGFTIIGGAWGGTRPYQWNYPPHRIVIANCMFAANQGPGLLVWIGSECGSVSLLNCTLSGNYGTGMELYGYGGEFDDVEMLDCWFLGNLGGGFVLDSSAVTMHNCVFSGNSNENSGISSGGAITLNCGWAPCGLLDFRGCTIVANHTQWSGGGIQHWIDYTPGFTVTDTILWGNTDSAGGGETAQIYAEGVNYYTELNYSCVQGWTGALGGVGNFGEDPLLADADGPDNVYGTSDDDVHLTVASPCVNAGDPLDPQDSATDFDGEPRMQHCRVDVGADESPFIGPDCNANGAADECDVEIGASADCDGNGVPDECENPTCDDIARLSARCRGALLTIRVALNSACHDGDAVTLDVNGVLYVVSIVGDTAVLRLHPMHGPTKVTLIDPAGCGQSVRVKCAMPLPAGEK